VTDLKLESGCKLAFTGGIYTLTTKNAEIKLLKFMRNITA